MPPFLEQFINAQKQIRIAKANLEFWEKQQKALQPLVIDYLVELGQNNLPVAGQTVYLHHKTWCSIDNKDPLALAAIKQAGLGSLVKEQVNAMDLTSYFQKEWQSDVAKAPADLVAFLKITEEVQARSREI